MISHIWTFHRQVIRKETIFIRVLFLQDPLFIFMCSCKSSAAHVYTSGSLKLERAPHVVPSTAYAVSGKPSRDGVKEEAVNGRHQVPKGCIRKPPPRVEVGKKRVQWMDKLGMELAEIKEFESSETGDTDKEEDRNCCLCVIL